MFGLRRLGILGLWGLCGHLLAQGGPSRPLPPPYAVPEPGWDHPSFLVLERICQQVRTRIRPGCTEFCTVLLEQQGATWAFRVPLAELGPSPLRPLPPPRWQRPEPGSKSRRRPPPTPDYVVEVDGFEITVLFETGHGVFR